MNSNNVSTLVLSTRNQGKIEELRRGLAGMSMEIATISDYPGFPEVEETADTLEGNARLKAEALFEFTGVPSLGDDTGLEVGALDGRPGVLSARFAGPEEDPARNRSLLLDVLQDVSDRRARFRTVLAYCTKTGTLFFDGVCEGRILKEEHGEGGFGYDAIFSPDGSDRSFAELTPDEKNAVSHRGRAIRAFYAFVTTQVGKVA